MFGSGREQPSKILQVGAVILAGILLNLFGYILFSLVAGKPPPAGITFSAGPIVFLSLMVASAPVRPLAPPDPTDTLLHRLREELDRSDLQNVKLYVGTDLIDLPRPFALGPSTTIPRRIAETWSPAALAWSTKTDSTASYRFYRRGTAGFLLGMLLALMAMALGERLYWPSGYWLVPCSIGFGAFLWFCVYGYRLQLIADRKFTRTENDLLAAKEALSYPFFAQGDKPLFQRWMFLRAELKGRARRLGIELERGYRVPDSD